MNRIIFLILTFALNHTAFSKEGLFPPSKTTPEIVKKSWDSVFLVLNDETSDFGTAFHIATKINGKNKELYFITNEHVVRDTCNGIGRCYGLSLYQDFEIEYVDGEMELSQIEGSTAFDMDNVVVVKMTKNPDLALLRVIIHKDNNFPGPIPLAKSCNRPTGDLYSIGYSDPTLRTYANALEIQDRDTVYKRWSQGIYVDFFQHTYPETGTHNFMGTTVDALPGGSGGPVINEKGEVIGIMKGVAGNRGNGYRYDGNEVQNQHDWHSMVISCDVLQDYIIL